jgi:Flp pilus assembly pilin Flp
MNWRNDPDGATSIEYAMIASFISILIVAGVTSIGTDLSGFFTALIGHL